MALLLPRRARGSAESKHRARPQQAPPLIRICKPNTPGRREGSRYQPRSFFLTSPLVHPRLSCTIERHHVIRIFAPTHLHPWRTRGHPRHGEAQCLGLLDEHLLHHVRGDVPLERISAGERDVTAAERWWDAGGGLDLIEHVLADVVRVDGESVALHVVDPTGAAAARRTLVDGETRSASSVERGKSGGSEARKGELKPIATFHGLERGDDDTR